MMAGPAPSTSSADQEQLLLPRNCPASGSWIIERTCSQSRISAGDRGVSIATRMPSVTNSKTAVLTNSRQINGAAFVRDTVTRVQFMDGICTKDAAWLGGWPIPPNHMSLAWAVRLLRNCFAPRNAALRRQAQASGRWQKTRPNPPVGPARDCSIFVESPESGGSTSEGRTPRDRN